MSKDKDKVGDKVKFYLYCLFFYSLGVLTTWLENGGCL